jgi:NAD-dependent dihydropyrimidine dehydrogenase PreA subunit
MTAKKHSPDIAEGQSEWEQISAAFHARHQPQKFNMFWGDSELKPVADEDGKISHVCRPSSIKLTMDDPEEDSDPAVVDGKCCIVCRSARISCRTIENLITHR